MLVGPVRCFSYSGDLYFVAAVFEKSKSFSCISLDPNFYVNREFRYNKFFAGKWQLAFLSNVNCFLRMVFGNFTLDFLTQNSFLGYCTWFVSIANICFGVTLFCSLFSEDLWAITLLFFFCSASEPIAFKKIVGIYPSFSVLATPVNSSPIFNGSLFTLCNLFINCFNLCSHDLFVYIFIPSVSLFSRHGNFVLFSVFFHDLWGLNNLNNFNKLRILLSALCYLFG